MKLTFAVLTITLVFVAALVSTPVASAQSPQFCAL